MKPLRLNRLLLLTLLSALLVPLTAIAAQQAAVPATQSVRAIRPPTNPIPPEAASAGVTKFSFIAYGDTRGRRDGIDPQYEHSLVIDAMLRTISSMANGPDPVRFVLQSGDAVVNGRDASQWNESFVGLINRITTEAGLPFFLAPGNHDVTGSANVQAAPRQEGLRNYLAAIGALIPPDGATRRLAGYPTFAFGFGNTFFIAFDSNIAEDSTQFAWVSAQLQGLDRKRYTNIVVNFHHPVFSSGPHGGPTVERPTLVLREKWMPLFRRHHVNLLLVGHEHVFEHWVERYVDSSGARMRLDQVVSGGGGAPLYAYTSEPNLTEYQRADPAARVRVEHLVKPGPDPGDNPYHYVVVHVDGSRMWLEVVGVDWGSRFAPYRSARSTMVDTSASRMR